MLKRFLKHISLVIFTLGISLYSQSQILTNSNLPIVIITTDTNPYSGEPSEIEDETRCLATMKIIWRPNNARNYVSDQNTATYLNYNGRIEIETRGSTSQIPDKKPYSLTTLLPDNVSKNNVKLLGMPKENDWILNALSYEPSYIRDCLSYELSRRLGNYASRGKYCEVIINGDYKGLYLLMEKLKIDDDRIDIEKMNQTNIDYPDVTGGYITKTDKTTGGDPVAWNMSSYNWSCDFIHENPKPEEITSEQHSYIYDQFLALEYAMEIQNSSVEDGYPSIIDVPSFIDFMIINELASNVDAYQYSTFFHKDKNGKLRAGPVWDFNLTYGNDLTFWGLDRSFTNVWQFDNYDNTGPKFWKDLYDDPSFNCYLSKRLYQLTRNNQPLHYNSICNIIDSLVTVVSEAIVREDSRWYTGGDITDTISTLKSWISSRITWMQSELNNYSACSNPYIPSLVISKIHYYPQAITPELSSNLEFIEITNSGSTAVDVGGLYFRNMGINYQFPIYTSIEPNQNIYLASNSIEFESFYGFEPFGEFTRSLSNKSEEIILADGFGNIIDYVKYHDTLPWPIQANGGGYYLQSDNSLASSWAAVNYALEIPEYTIQPKRYILNYPESKYIQVISNSNIESYIIYDVTGRILKQKDICTSNYISKDNLIPAIYFITCTFSDDSREQFTFFVK